MTERIPVLYGTETGNAEYCADMLAEAIQECGFNAEAVDMAFYTPEDIAKEYLVFVVTSTFGNGDPPANAKLMLNFLKTTSSELGSLRFGVCALGDSSYTYFAQCGRDFDAALGKLGAQRVIERLDCDEDFDDNFESFKEQVVAYLTTHKAELTQFAS